MSDKEDYYDSLQLTRSATVNDINNAYRRLALEFHPDKSDDTEKDAKFLVFAEAYAVLSDPKRRAIYDTFGFDQLRDGAPNSENGYTDGWSFHGDAHKVFKDFFGGENPFQDLFPKLDEHGLVPILYPRTRKTQGEAVTEPLMITLEEAFNGCIKKMRIRRQVMNDDLMTSAQREKILSIQVKPGWKEGTKITFPKEGDQDPNKIPSDVTFVLKYHAHARFTRVGDDLVHVAKIDLAGALTGLIVELLTLDDRLISIPVNDVVSPGYELKVPGEGMPISKSPKLKGNLILRFDVTFPRDLSEDSKRLIRQALE
eukprot:m.265461 g.265461  ORF g.265461 m.265461 type:complete len:313 (+) comp61891_c0_seq1:189-1127(+)